MDYVGTDGAKVVATQRCEGRKEILELMARLDGIIEIITSNQFFRTETTVTYWNSH